MHYFHQDQKPEGGFFPPNVLSNLPIRKMAIIATAYLIRLLFENNPSPPTYVHVPNPFHSGPVSQSSTLDSVVEAFQQHPSTKTVSDVETTRYTLNVDYGKRESKADGQFSIKVRKIDYIDYFFPPGNPKGGGKGDVLRIEADVMKDGEVQRMIFKFTNLGREDYRCSVKESDTPIAREALRQAFTALGMLMDDTYKEREEETSPSSPKRGRNNPSPLQPESPIKLEQQKKRNRNNRDGNPSLPPDRFIPPKLRGPGNSARLPRSGI